MLKSNSLCIRNSTIIFLSVMFYQSCFLSPCALQSVFVGVSCVDSTLSTRGQCWGVALCIFFDAIGHLVNKPPALCHLSWVSWSNPDYLKFRSQLCVLIIIHALSAMKQPVTFYCAYSVQAFWWDHALLLNVVLCHSWI